MSDVDRYEPKLRVRNSGRKGSGYVLPTRLDEDGKPLVVPGVTTALNALDKPGILRWSIDQVVAYAVTHVDELLNRSEEAGYRFLQYVLNRMKPGDFDDPLFDVRNSHRAMLDDLAELGTMTHTWISDFLTTGFPEELVRDEQAQMASAFLDWYEDHDVEVIALEVTVVGDGYAGTFDAILRIDGVVYLIDFKTSRRTRDEHFAQLGALGAAESMYVEVDEGDPDGVLYDSKKWGKTYWKEEPLPAFSKYGLLHLRPKTDEGPAFCVLKEIPHEVIAPAYELFRASLDAANARYILKQAKKEVGFDE